MNLTELEKSLNLKPGSLRGHTILVIQEVNHLVLSGGGGTVSSDVVAILKKNGWKAEPQGIGWIVYYQ